MEVTIVGGFCIDFVAFGLDCGPVLVVDIVDVGGEGERREKSVIVVSSGNERKRVVR